MTRPRKLDFSNFSLAYHGNFPDKLKIKKKVLVWPLELGAMGIWDLHTSAFSQKFNCKVRSDIPEYCRARFCFDVQNQQILRGA